MYPELGAEGPAAALRVCHPPRGHEPSGPHSRGGAVCRQAHPGAGLDRHVGLGSQPACPHCRHQGNSGTCTCTCMCTVTVCVRFNLPLQCFRDFTGWTDVCKFLNSRNSNNVSKQYKNQT